MMRACARLFVPLSLTLALVACETTAEPELADAVAISPSVIQMDALGATRQLEVAVTDESGDEIDDAVVTWSSTGPAVATVSSTGLVTAVSNGSADIVATSDGVTASATVTVQQLVHSIVFGTDSVALNYLGAERALLAQALDSRGNLIDDAVIAWRSSAPQIVSVSNGLVRAQTQGTAFVTAQASNSVSATVPVRVQQRAAFVLITPEADALQAGQSIDVTATVRDSGNVEILGASVVWSSGSPDIASILVSSSALVATVSGVAAGIATITATSDGVAGSALMTVLQFLPVAHLDISPDSAVAQVGGVVSFAATLRDPDGNVLSADVRPITWTSSAPTVVLVPRTGAWVEAYAWSLGTATIIATSGGAADTVTVRVGPLCETSTPIAPGQTLEGSLAPGDCAALGLNYDVWVLTVPAGMSVGLRVQVTASAFDASLAVSDGWGDWSVYAEDPGPGDHARVEQWFPEGTYTIHVSSVAPAAGSYSLSALTVPVASISLDVDSVVIGVYSSFHLTHTLRDANGEVINPFLANVTFTSSAPEIVETQFAWVYGQAEGNATIIASSNGHADTAQVRVVPSCGSTIALGDTMDGVLSSSNCTYPGGGYYQIWRVSLLTDTTVVVQLSSPSFPTSLLVFDASGENNYEDSGSDTSSRIEGFLYQGTAWIYVRSTTPGATGDFRLTVTGQ